MILDPLKLTIIVNHYISSTLIFNLSLVKCLFALSLWGDVEQLALDASLCCAVWKFSLHHIITHFRGFFFPNKTDALMIKLTVNFLTVGYTTFNLRTKYEATYVSPMLYLR